MANPLHFAGVQAYLPLTISTVEGDSDGVLVGGRNWHLRINTSWIFGNSMQPTTARLESAEADSTGRLALAVEGHQVSRLGLQFHDSFEDIFLALDDGNVLEVVSDFPYGEWILSIWLEDDPKRLPVLDLSGPVQ